ncbi:MAG: phosphoribosylamine--glycine ligase [Cyanobacteria bacterium SBLK]|nr:phosphoribosylamine--glycine ligase [Cyanobacteria bacterium SBLK]
MKVLVVGNGGREHAIAWKLAQSDKINRIICVPGNGGTASLDKCQNMPMRIDDFEGIARFAAVQGVSLVIIGPEAPLAEGLADYLLAQNLPVFGPTQAGAQIESSKSWAKALMEDAGVPTAKGETFTDAEKAKTYIQKQGAPIVVKADGLASGKGVIVAQTPQEAKTAVDTLWDKGFRKIVVEEFLSGEEVSVFAIADGITFRTLLPAQDHKRIGEGDTGLNTGGMGAYAPAPIVTPELMAQIEEQIFRPIVSALKRKDIDYRGVLYAGLIVAPTGEPKVLEFNCRFGDPETQAILPLLETPLDRLLMACAQQKLADLPPLEWKAEKAVCIVAASAGYPEDYQKGKAIAGIPAAEELEALVFHAGTKKKSEGFATTGGRVLGVTALGEDFDGAIATSYQAIERIEFEGIYYRRDIANRVRPQSNPVPANPAPDTHNETEDVWAEKEEE